MLEIINPATETVIETLEADSSQSIRNKVHKARSALAHWNKTSFATRSQIIKIFQQLLAQEQQRLAHIQTSETGKPITQSNNEIAATSSRIQFFLDHTESVLKSRTAYSEEGLVENISFEPVGVLANISAWNYPYFIGSNVIIPALLTGNTILYKPSEYATLTGIAIHDLLRRAGIPENVFQLLIGAGETGKILMQQPIDGIFFTGSYQTGKKIANLASQQMMQLQLELGGKDPVYVCNNVNVQASAASIADGTFYNAGQSCCAIERIYVQDTIFDDFVSHFLVTVRSFELGDPTKPSTYLGPLTRENQLNVLNEQIRDAVAKGAKILCGGTRADRPGYFFEPTVLIGVDHSMQLMQDESFGPIIGIQRVKTDQEAIQCMNDSEYGLTASIYCRDSENAENLMRQLDAGTVYWNCCDRVSPHLPWTGRKHSGIGTTLSTLGIQSFLQTKSWHMKREV